MKKNGTVGARRHGKLPWIAVTTLFIICVVPVVALFSVGAILERGCVLEGAANGEAGASMLWRIEAQRCGDGPLVSNVLLAPRGMSFALVASATGTPRPIAVERVPDGAAVLRLEGNGSDGLTTILLPLKGTGRPQQPLVLANGRPKG